MGPSNLRARRLFEGIADSYDRPAELLSLGQYGRWRRFALRCLDCPRGARVLDVATGTGLVAADLQRGGARVVGLDLTPEMLQRAVARGIAVVCGRAEELPFASGSFDRVAFTYLLRYVDDPEATLAELARVLRRDGVMASVEFGMPTLGVLRAGWQLYALKVLPRVSAALSPGWKEVGRFLGPSIASFDERFPPPVLEGLWRRAGLTGVRTRRLSSGAGVVTWGTKS
jgi:demethylmenaquinone methyltransferase/2-methoxy-6-polyprenyl-1,4-benzoquinol methylase